MHKSSEMCDECGYKLIVVSRGNLTCPKCGLESLERNIDAQQINSQEANKDDRFSTINRNFTSHKDFFKDRRKTRCLEPSKDITTSHEIRIICRGLELPLFVQQDARWLYTQARKDSSMERKRVFALVYSAIYLACIRNKFPCDLEEIITLAREKGIQSSYLRKIIYKLRRITNYGSIRQSSNLLLTRIASVKDINPKIYSGAIKIIAATYHFERGVGTQRQYIASAVFISALENGTPLSKYELAKAFGISRRTLKRSILKLRPIWKTISSSPQHQSSPQPEIVGGAPVSM